MEQDPLSSLIVKKQELDRKLLAEVLAPYVRLDQESGIIMQTPEFISLTNADKILVFLLARKAAKTLNLLSEPENLSPKAISTLTGINYDSVKPTLSALFKKRILQKNGDAYLVPDHAILMVRSQLETAAKKAR
jgi:predicted transcriptional regulator